MSSLSLRIMVLGPLAYWEYIRGSSKGARLNRNGEYRVRRTYQVSRPAARASGSFPRTLDPASPSLRRARDLPGASHRYPRTWYGADDHTPLIWRETPPSLCPEGTSFTVVARWAPSIAQAAARRHASPFRRGRSPDG